VKRIEKIHRYRGWNTAGGQCGLEIFDPPDGVPVKVLTHLPWNTNTSVSHMSFRRVRQIPPPTETTIEAVRLLRTYFGRQARRLAPLATTLGREDLPGVDPPESGGELFVTELGEWLFFPNRIRGVKVLSDEAVASYWDMRPLTRQLLVSVRQHAEILLAYLELRRDHPDFSSALVEYFAHPEKLTVEIIESQNESARLWLEAHRRETTPRELEDGRSRYGPWEEQRAHEA